ncbi:MAG: DinB family protein [Acidobacteria bacterium]|nr:DinB family protein [Acidobacteriota bacterium]
MNRPEKNEYAEYYDRYISLIPEGEIVPILEKQIDDMAAMFAGVPEDKGTFSYAPGKWTTKESLSHVIDAERIFAYRLLRISRGDETPLEGFDQEGYIENSNANARSFADLLEEFALQRRSNLLLIRNLSDAASRRMGTASDNPVSARALAYMLAGHVKHHENIFRNNYLA